MPLSQGSENIFPRSRSHRKTKHVERDYFIDIVAACHIINAINRASQTDRECQADLNK